VLGLINHPRNLPNLAHVALSARPFDVTKRDALSEKGVRNKQKKKEKSMGLFSRMFGKGASEDEAATKRFNELQQKYQTALNVIDQQGVQLQNLHIQDDKLYIKGTAPSQDVANHVWDQVKLVNPSLDDLTLELSVAQGQAAAATAQSEQQSQAANQSYTVKSGDTLSKISRHFYGNANEYMRIFYANRDKLHDPDKIQVGQELVIPPDTDA
jgi:LysM repeat protein